MPEDGNKNKAGLGKIVLFTTALIGGVFLGEKTQPLKSINNFVTYYNVSAEDGTPTDFRNYNARIVINDKGRAELYFGNSETEEYRKVNPDGTVGSLGQKIDDYLGKKKEQVKGWYDGIKRNY